jgi:hypothetical protein
MWVREFAAINDEMIATDKANASPVIFIENLTGISRQIISLIFAVGVISVFSFLWLRRSLNNFTAKERELVWHYLETTALLIAGVFTFVFSSKLVWIHYLVLLIPAQIILFRPRQSKFSQVATSYFLGGLAFLLLGINSWDIWVGPHTPKTIQMTVLLGLICLFLATIISEIRTNLRDNA